MRRIALLALGALLAAGCGATEPAPQRPAGVREVIEPPIANVAELRWHFGAELRRAGYAGDWAPAKDAGLIEGYMPQGSPGGWAATLIDRDPMQAGYRGHVGIVRRRLRHPSLRRPELGCIVEVAQRSSLDAHYLLLKRMREFDGIDIEPVNADSRWAALLPEPGLGEAAVARLAAWDGRDADRAISHLHFVRGNITISLAWVVARVDRAKDNDRLIIEAAAAIDAQLRAATQVQRLASSQRSPYIEAFALAAEGPLTPGDSKHAYRVTVTAKPRTGGLFHLFVEAGGPGRKIWDGEWGDVYATDDPTAFDYVPGRATGPRELWAFAVNERGCIGEKKLDVEVVAAEK